MLHVKDVKRAFELGEGEVVAPVPKDGRVAHVDGVFDGLWMGIDSNDRRIVRSSREERKKQGRREERKREERRNVGLI